MSPAGPHTAAIALGSNLPSTFGDLEANLRRALTELSGLGRVLAVSSHLQTDPVGYTDQPRFVNAAAVLQTNLEPSALLHALLAIERRMGRDRSAVVPKGPRIIDLDLILFDDVVLETPGLTLPHPEMHRRRFVLEPLAEISPTWLHPILQLTVAELLAQLPPV